MIPVCVNVVHFTLLLFHVVHFILLLSACISSGSYSSSSVHVVHDLPLSLGNSRLQSLLGGLGLVTGGQFPFKAVLKSVNENFMCTSLTHNDTLQIIDGGVETFPTIGNHLQCVLQDFFLIWWWGDDELLSIIFLQYIPAS